MGCAQTAPTIPEGVACDKPELDHLIGENVWRLSEHPHQNFTIVAHGDDWDPANMDAGTFVFLDRNDRIFTFGCAE